MPIYAVSYDLINEKDYPAIKEAIESHKHCKIHKSFWVIQHKGNAEKAREDLRKSLDNDDKLFVIELKTDWASTNLTRNQVECLKSGLKLSL